MGFLLPKNPESQFFQNMFYPVFRLYAVVLSRKKSEKFTTHQFAMKLEKLILDQFFFKNPSAKFSQKINLSQF